MNGNSRTQEINLRTAAENVSKSAWVRAKKRKRTVERRVIARLPSRSAAEIPILLLLSSSSGGEMTTKSVLHELRNGKWFSELRTEDKEVVYEKSRKNALDTILKFSKKSLVIKKQVFPFGEVREVGIWKITESGIERARREGDSWRATYSDHHAIEIDFEDIPDAVVNDGKA
jgi:hypothetical protein